MNTYKAIFQSILLISFSLLIINASVASSSDASPGTPGMSIAMDAVYHGIYKNKNVHLKDGKWSGVPFVKGGASRPTVGLIKDFSFIGDVDGNGSDERVVFLWESSGGSGTRVFMAILGSQNNKIANLSTHLIGDRVQLRMGRVNQGKIELDVIQATHNDAACCPTHKVLRSWSLKNNQLIESKAQSLGSVSMTDLEGVQWRLTHINWREALPKDINITLQVEGDKISGRSGCNHYFASIKPGKSIGELNISKTGGTRMACPEDLMELESRFLKALSNIEKYSFVNGKLALSYKDGEAFSSLLFTAQLARE